LLTIGWISLIVGLVTIAIGVGLILLIALRKKQPTAAAPIVATDTTTPAAEAPSPAGTTPAAEAPSPAATTPAAEPRPAVDTAFPTTPDDNAPTQ
jgi:flagellar basal body-associated protein FliL